MDKPSVDGFRVLTWDDLCKDPHLQDLPFKIELNRFNQIVMAPADASHSIYQSEIAYLLRRLLAGGKTIVELAVMTGDNVKVPDVVWAARKTMRMHEGESSWSSAPEICVEVFSPTNTRAEMRGKRLAYFQAGAQEVWTCDLKGKMSFYSPTGSLEKSTLCPKFPLRVKL